MKKFIFLILIFCIQGIQSSEPLTKSLYMKIKYPSVYPISSDNNIFQKENGHKNLKFIIKLPSDLLSPDWSVIISPELQTVSENVMLPEVVINGENFKQKQDQQYVAYEEYVSNTIDSTLYKQEYINYQQLKDDIEHKHDEYWQYFYDEWDKQIDYEMWKSKQNTGSNRYFYPNVRESYEEQIIKQYLLRIKIQTDRYLKADMDTTGLYNKYINECIKHIKKLPRYSVELDSIKNVPKQFKYIYDGHRTLDDITDAMWKLLNEQDSVLMNLPVFDFEKIKQNEKRRILVDNIFKSMVTLPRVETSLADSTLVNYNDDLEYIYVCPNEFTDYLSDTINIKLYCRVRAIDESIYNTSSQVPLQYIFKGENISGGRPKTRPQKLNTDSITNWFE